MQPALATAVSVRAASIEDAGAIAKVQVDAWRAAYAGIVADGTLSAASYNATARKQLLLLADKARFVFVAVDSGIGVVGFATGGASRCPVAGCDGEIHGLYVHPTRHGRGIGKLLAATTARSLEDHGFSRVMVWVLSENHRARGFYERTGGARIGQREIGINGQRLRETCYGWDSATLAKLPLA